MIDKKFKTSKYPIFDQIINEKILKCLGYRKCKIDLKVDISEPHKQYSYGISVLGTNLTPRNYFRAAIQLIVLSDKIAAMYFHNHLRFVDRSHLIKKL